VSKKNGMTWEIGKFTYIGLLKYLEILLKLEEVFKKSMLFLLKQLAPKSVINAVSKGERKCSSR
jgi:hypothetical protein